MDFLELSKYKWRLGGKYARNNDLGQMHRFILTIMLNSEIPKNMEVDHINGDRLDNRRENLRLCTHSENGANCKRGINKWKYRGVSNHRRLFAARIQKDKKKIHIGLYKTPKIAAKAYDKKARELFGEFAFTNF